MVVIGIAVVWTGFLVGSYGWHVFSSDGVGFLDLALPGHWASHPHAKPSAAGASGTQTGGTLVNPAIPGLEGGIPLVGGQIPGPTPKRIPQS